MTRLSGAKNAQIHNRLAGLDHLRALAIILVFVFHYAGMFPHPEWTQTISHFGWTGVDLFFVLSGYLIASQLFSKIAQEKLLSFKEFFLKRFFRIIPAYLVVLTLYFMFPAIREREALAPSWKYLTFTQNLGLDLRSQGTFSHAWSLCIEEQFYLFLPIILITLVYFKAMKRGFILLLLLFAFGFFARLYSWDTLVSPYADNNDFGIYWYKWIYYPTYCRLDGLLAGVAIAGIFQFYPSLKNKIHQYGNLFLVTSLLVLTGAYFLSLDQQTFNASLFAFPLVSMGYGFMVLSAVSPKCFLYKFNSGVTKSIATLSYSIYLTHKIVIHLSQTWFSSLNIEKDSTNMFLICIVTTLSGAFLLNKIIEKPFLKWRGKILTARYENSIQTIRG